MNSNLRDGLHFASKLTPARLANVVQVVGSYYLSKWTGKARHSGFPVSIAFEPTTSCNLRCPECPSGLRSFTRPTGMLRNELFRKVIDEVSDKILYLIFYFQGEPYLHPSFLDLVSYASSRKIYTATSTNAHYLTDDNARKTVESGLDRLIISMDGTTQETYESYRIGGRLEKVLEGARNVVRWKKKLKSKTPHTIFQFLVVRPNEHQVADVRRLAREIGVDEVGLKTAQIYDYANGSPLIPDQSKYSRYRKTDDGRYVIRNRMLNHCWKLWHSCVITWDGTVVPCCFDKDAAHALGSVQDKTFTEVWKNGAYQAFRQSVLNARSEMDICRNCSEGTTVWA